MFETLSVAETRVPAFGSEPHLALSSSVEAAPSKEVIVPLRKGNLTLLASGAESAEVSSNVAAICDKHFLEHELKELKRQPSVKSYISCAMLYLQTRRSGEALTLLDEALVKFAEDYWLKHLHAVALGEVGRLAESEQNFKMLSADRPTDWRPRHALGRVQMQADRWAHALSSLKEASTLDGATSRVFNDLGTAFIALRDVRGAMKALRRALAIDPRFTLAHNNLGVCFGMQGSADRARRSFLTALECDPDCTAAVHNLAESYIAAECFDQAVDLLEPHIQTHPNDAHSIERLAWAHFRLGSGRRAAALLREGATRSEAVRDAFLNNLGIICRAIGKDSDAEAAFRLAVKASESRLDVRMNYALLLRSYRRWTDLIAVLPEQLALNEPNAVALRGLALAALGRPQDARLLIEKALESFPGNDALIIPLGHLLCSHLDAPEEAIELLQRSSIGRCERHPLIPNNLAYALIKAGHLEEARKVLASEYAKRQAETDSTALCIRATWGLLRIREGAFEEGLRLYREALSDASPELAERLRQKILIEEGRHLLRQQQRDLAVRKLKKAIGLQADNEFTTEARKLLRSLEPAN